MATEGACYATHVLELVRNNGISTMENQVDQGFLMFDYFDILIHKELKGTEKQYVNYFSIGDTFNDDQAYKVSYKTLSLYCDSDHDSNPFVMETEEGKKSKELSRIPFLGIIQISLCKENYVRPDRRQVDIDTFLRDCENRIMEMVRSSYKLDENDPTIMQLYRSSTTGDFCLVIRTESIEKIYNTALFLSDSQSDEDKLPKVRTYTNVGIECKICDDAGSGSRYATLSDEFINAHKNMTFALRFSANRDLLSVWERYQRESGKARLEAAKGLFGRYDYLLHINLEDFSEIYPVLCEKKFGVVNKTISYEEGNITLKNILRHPHIKNINERVLVELDTAGMEGTGKYGTDREYLDKVQKRNEQLFRRIDKLGKWRSCFAEEDRAFRDLHRGMMGIYKTFSAIGMEKDAYINWLIFCRDMDVLCECLEVCLEEYESIRQKSSGEVENRVYRQRLLKDWRINIQALNQYTRLVQNINYQTYQSPIYEIQTQIDTEKTMIAYRQAMMSYMDSYIEDENCENEDVIPSLPIIYPDLAKDRVEVIAPFSNQRKKEGRLVKREIMCTVPSFEYFGRLYDLLPWMLHESSHHLRVLNRKDRNRFFVEYIFSYIYRVVLENEIAALADDSLYKTVGRVGRRLIGCMVKVTMDDFAVSTGNKFEDFGLERLISEIDACLSAQFHGSSGFEGKRAQYDVKETRNKVFVFFLNEYRREGLLDDAALKQIINFKGGVIEGDGDNLVEPLLDCYFQQVNETADDPLERQDGMCCGNIKKSREWFEKDILQMGEKLKSAGALPDAVKEYIFRISEMYRIVSACITLHRGGESENENIQDYLKKVFRLYQKQEQAEGWKDKDELLMDPCTMHMLRNLGLLNKEEDIFCSQMQDIFRRNDYIEIQKHKELKTKIYRETFADLLMATSLGIGSFGYCRQVLQTLSDVGMDEKGYGVDNINTHRFRIVTAILLEEELREAGTAVSPILEDEDINRIKLDGKGIIEDGIVYCEYTLKCIGQKLREEWQAADEKEREKKESNKESIEESNKEADKRLELLQDFLGGINAQLRCFLKEIDGSENYANTFLYVILHGRDGADPETVKNWEAFGFTEIAELCQTLKYSFWRLEYFCLGLKNIMCDGYVSVPLDIFRHMKRIRQAVKGEDGKGCRWEKDWDCLLAPKMDVGKFYNDPKQVLDKTSSQKLENTIRFIQNYYYYNRFRMMEEEGENGACKKEG